MFVLLAYTLAALAGEPATCEAVFVGPVKDCDLRGGWVATGAGRNENKAREAALARLHALIQAVADEAVILTAGTLASGVAAGQRESCPAKAVAAAKVTCTTEGELGRRRACYVDLPDHAECRNDEIDVVDGTPWKLMESERARVCAEIDAALAANGAPPAKAAACRVACLQDVRVRCPP